MAIERAGNAPRAVLIGSVAALGAISSVAHADPEGAPAPPVEVLVTGDKADTLKRGSGSSTAIGQKEIERAQPASSGELLQRVPGIQVRQEDPMGLRLNIGVRGLSPTRSRLVLVEEDGVPVVVSPYGEPELYYMTAVERVQRLEVVKGSDVLRYGPQTVGAAVRLQTWEPTETPNWYVAGTVGSHSFGEGLARFSNTHEGVGYVVQAFHKEGDGFRNMGFRSTDAFAKARFATGNNGQLRVKIAFHDELAKTTYTGLTDLLYRQDPRRDTVAPDDHFAIRRYEASLAHEQQLTPSTVLRTSLFAYHMDLGLRLQDFDRNRLPQIDYSSVADPTGLFFRSTTSLRDRTYDVAGISAELEKTFVTGSVRHRALLGARAMDDVSRRQLSTGSFPSAESGDLITDDATRIYGLSAWVEDQLAMSDLVVLTPAFRIEHSNSKKTTYRIADDTRAPHDVHLVGTSSSTGAMPGLGLAIGTARLNAFSSFYLGYSAPRVSQAITPDGTDQNLHAERSRNHEVGGRLRAGKWLRAEADAFWIEFDNQLVSNNPLSGVNSEFVDGGRTRHLGAEATFIANLDKALSLPLDVDLAGHYTFVRARFVGGSFEGRTIPYSPMNSAEVTLDVGRRAGLSGQVALGYVGSQYTDEQNTVEGGPTGLDGRINGYTTLDLAARYRHDKSGLGIALAAKSVLDRVYISDRLPNGIFTAGFRQLFATLSWSTPSAN
ncbi:MAG TPA: TonB-dependent receptor [Polyangiaceae bacterium]|nr:TonB-dependent receptor [Polyangiaceae bacterium]